MSALQTFFSLQKPIPPGEFFGAPSHSAKKSTTWRNTSGDHVESKVMTHNRIFPLALDRYLIQGMTGILLATTVACGGKKDSEPGTKASIPIENNQPVAAGGAPPEADPRQPLTPMETDDGACPEEALIDLEGGRCLEGAACPLGYAEVVLEEDGRRACEATPWLDQFGSEADDVVVAVERDLDGNTIVVGSTGGGLEGDDAGDFDVFVRVYDDTGEVLWTQQFGSEANDLAADVAIGPDSRIFVVGRSFELVESEEGGDIFVEVINQNGFVYSLSDDGEIMWHREISTDMAAEASAVSVDAEGRAHVAGATNGPLVEAGQRGGYDGFFIVYDTLGDVLDTRVFGGDWDDFVADIALDEKGGVVLSGSTSGSIGSEEDFEGVDAFVLRYDNEYEFDWARPFGTEGEDRASALAIADDGTIHVGGDVGGQLGESAFGGRDFFLRSYTASGELQWTRQYGTEGQDRIHAMSVGLDGLLYFAGDTMGSFAAEKAGKMEGFFGVVTSDGDLVDIRDFGTTEDDSIRAIAVDEDGAAFLGGSVGAPLPEQEHLGLLDAVVAKVAFD